MRKLIALCSVALAACSTVPAEGSEPVGGKCRAEGLERFVGQAGSAENGAAILRAIGREEPCAGSRTVRPSRWITASSA